jgi:hypothetical protein
VKNLNEPLSLTCQACNCKFTIEIGPGEWAGELKYSCPLCRRRNKIDLDKTLHDKEVITF